MKSFWVTVGLPRGWCLCERRERWTGTHLRRAPCVWMEAKVGARHLHAQGCPGSRPPLEARGGPGPDSSSEPPEGTHFANTFTLDFWPPKLYKNPFLLPEAPQFVFIHYRSRGK